MENKAHALAAGAFVLMVSALLVALAIWLTHESGVQLLYEVSTSDTVTGLQSQASVRFRGVKVGKVTSIGFDSQNTGHVLVQLAINEGTPITRSTFASLGFQGVTGIAFVQLDDSGASKELLPSSVDHPARIPMRPGLMGQLSDQGARLLTQLEETSRRVNLLLAPDNQKALLGTIGAISQAVASVPPVMQEAGSTLKTLREASGSLVGGAQEVQKSAAEFGRLTLRVQQPGGTLDQISQGAGALATTGQAVQADSLPRLHRTMDDAGRAARQVGRAASVLNDNPQALIFGERPVAPGPGEPGFVAPGSKP